MPDKRHLEVLRLLKANGAVRVRQRKHHVYHFPDGRPFVLPSTPSDVQAWHYSLATLKRFLGMQPRRKERSGDWTKPRPRRKKTPNTVPVRQRVESRDVPTTTLRSALEEILVQRNDFEALMLAQGVMKLEAA